MLVGRHAECARLDALLTALRDGRSAALVVVGEAGVGKSALLDHAVRSGTDVRVMRASGVESEMELPYAALHQLCLPLLDGINRLPTPQADALARIFGMRAGDVPSPFFVGLGILNLLADAAREQPLLCLVDDAHWLDEASAQVLTFVARRLRAESILLVIASRRAIPAMQGLAELTVRGLGSEDAKQLLNSVLRWPMDDGVRAAILAEARGNPLALLELPLASPDRLAGGYGFLEASALPGRIEESFRRRIAELPADCQDLLLLAAADSTGDPVLVWRAAASLGLSPEAARPAAEVDLLAIGVRTAFRHGLVRSAVYRSASAEARRRAHRALAEATSAQADPDRRAWHLAHATENQDEAVALELEASADRAQSRGGLAAAAAFLERAASLTADPAVRADRELAAAQAKYHAGAPEGARVLLDKVEAGPADELRSAQVRHLRAYMAFATGDSAQAPVLLLDTARRFERLDPVLSRENYLDALAYALMAGRYADRATVADVAAAALTAPSAGADPHAPDQLLDAYAVLFTEGHAAGTALVRRALDAFRRDELPVAEATRWLVIAAHGAYEIWDDEAWEALTALNVRHTRASGALTMLPVVLTQRIAACLHAGRFQDAADLLQESEAVAEATGIARPAYDAAAVAAWRGDTEAHALIQAAEATAAQRGEGLGVTLINYTNAVLHNGLGAFEQAKDAAALAAANLTETAFASWALSEWIEAAIRCGDRNEAEHALERLARTTTPSGTAWGAGIEARSRALLAEGPPADALYREAIDKLGRSHGVVALARAHLLYGEWLRRQGREPDARAHLTTAHTTFTDIGAQAFAHRTRAELTASGISVPQPTTTPTVELTEQERQIARRAREGRSNAEIGAELFLSARTIEWHLRKVFTKLGISSRKELRTALP
ncbi:transcriptional regulator, LuxR family [Catenulispora acidiphila DSM 44928]|uniref:Transcriptional regulator, LuxR family n=1 Tax=Catenulispora acidiphila (strain DSM 44928 / JCM 14897 / NBRC 102108 / NRRL B-24433 / ID139908) TaxID=479433 RepID=C7Q6G7_CATAD|nr:LuxR family transcriptional regulator [Catenulispora acidiphila]ACU74002.1 transcriptional regulator, LuxR family [Catenulispora acidiphila DSM 44928]